MSPLQLHYHCARVLRRGQEMVWLCTWSLEKLGAVELCTCYLARNLGQPWRPWTLIPLLT